MRKAGALLLVAVVLVTAALAWDAAPAALPAVPRAQAPVLASRAAGVPAPVVASTPFVSTARLRGPPELLPSRRKPGTAWKESVCGPGDGLGPCSSISISS